VAAKYRVIVTTKNMAAIEVYPLNFTGQIDWYETKNYIDGTR
jgi:hypothetical protein